MTYRERAAIAWQIGQRHPVDLRIRGRGLDFIWARKYRSRIGPNTAQGNGWDFSYNIHIERSGDNIIVHDGNNRSDTYSLQPDGTYVRNELFQLGTFDTGAKFTMTFSDTGTWQFRPLDGSPAQGKIAKITDRNGNLLKFEYSDLGRLTNIVDTLDRSIHIAYNADGFIESVTDFTGRQVRYAYYGNGEDGGSAGDLKSVTSPTVTGTPHGNDFPAGKTTTYTYSKGFTDDRLNHNLLTITDPKGQTWLRNFYASTENPDDINFDRVVRQAWGFDTNLLHYTYVAQTPSPENAFAVVKAIVNDRMGNVKECRFNSRNQESERREYTGRAVAGQPTTETENRPTGKLRPSDPDFFETRFEWNIDSLLVRVLNPNGNSVSNVYELALNPSAPRRSRGNLRERYQFPGPLGGDQSQIVERFEYDTGLGGAAGCCGFNFVTKHTDGRTNVTRHSYDERGNRTNTIHRITSTRKDFEFNAFGQITAHILPDNGSGHRRRDEFTYHDSGPQKGYMHQEIVDAGGFDLATTYEYNAVGVVTRVTDPRTNDTLYVVNQLDQVVRTISREVRPSSGIRYTNDTYFDANDNVVRIEIQNIDDQGVLQTNNIHFTTTYDYDILDVRIRMTQEVDSTHNVTNDFEHDANRNRSLIRSGEAVNGNQPANAVLTVHDERDLPFRKIRGPGSPIQSTTQFDYDGNRNPMRTSQGLEGAPRTALHVFDGFNRRVRTRDAMGNLAIYRYDENNNLSSERWDGELVDVPGSSGNVTLLEERHTFDAMDREIRRDTAFFAYSAAGIQTNILDGWSTKMTEYSANSQ